MLHACDRVGALDLGAEGVKPFLETRLTGLQLNEGVRHPSQEAGASGSRSGAGDGLGWDARHAMRVRSRRFALFFASVSLRALTLPAVTLPCSPFR